MKRFTFITLLILLLVSDTIRPAGIFSKKLLISKTLVNLIIGLILLICIIFPNQNLFAQWNYQINFTTKPLFGVYFKNETTGFVTGWEKLIMMTADGGKSWLTLAEKKDTSLNEIIFVNGSIGYSVGGLGIIFKTTNGGLNWFQLNSGTYLGFGGVSFVNANTGWVAGGLFFSPIILHTTDGGFSWIYQPFDSMFYDLSDISFINENTGIAVGINSILRTTNGGISWVRNPIGYLNSLNEVQFVDSNVVYTAGAIQGGDVLRSNDGGKTWTVIRSNFYAEILGMHFINSNTGTVVGTGGKIFRTTNGGSNWIEQSFKNNSFWIFNEVYFNNEYTGWIVGQYNGYGIILNTTNGGSIWTQLTEIPIIPTGFALSQNYPNPFNAVTNIKYYLIREGRVKITVYDVLGKLVSVLIDEYKAAGTHIIEFNGANFSSGVYFYEFKVTDVKPILPTDPVFGPIYIERRKLVLIK